MTNNNDNTDKHVTKTAPIERDSISQSIGALSSIPKQTSPFCSRPSSTQNCFPQDCKRQA